MIPEIIYSVYVIKNIINSKVYVGISKNPNKRLLDHKNNSKKQNYVLYKAIRKYGWNNFSFDIIYQTLNVAHVKEMESFFIREHKSFIHFEESNGYNMTLGGDGLNGYKNKNPNKQAKEYQFINPEGNKITIINLTEYCRINNLSQGNMNSLFYGKMISYKGYTAVNGKEKYKKYHFIDPNGNNITISNLSLYCKENDLNNGSMVSLNNEKIETYKGYRKQNPNTIFNIPKPKKEKIYKNPPVHLMNPNGEIIEITDIPKFCKENNLSSQNIHKVLRGERISHKGYKNINTPYDYKYKYKKECKVINPNGEIIDIYNISLFSKENGLNKNRLGKLINGKLDSYKGYTKYTENVI